MPFFIEIVNEFWICALHRYWNRKSHCSFIDSLFLFSVMLLSKINSIEELIKCDELVRVFYMLIIMLWPVYINIEFISQNFSLKHFSHYLQVCSSTGKFRWTCRWADLQPFFHYPYLIQKQNGISRSHLKTVLMLFGGLDRAKWI